MLTTTGQVKVLDFGLAKIEMDETGLVRAVANRARRTLAMHVPPVPMLPCSGLLMPIDTSSHVDGEFSMSRLTSSWCSDASAVTARIHAGATAESCEVKDRTDYWEAACTMSGGNVIPSALATS
jgi:hypothetical protein